MGAHARPELIKEKMEGKELGTANTGTPFEEFCYKKEQRNRALEEKRDQRETWFGFWDFFSDGRNAC